MGNKAIYLSFSGRGPFEGLLTFYWRISNISGIFCFCILNTSISHPLGNLQLYVPFYHRSFII